MINALTKLTLGIKDSFWLTVKGYSPPWCVCARAHAFIRLQFGAMFLFVVSFKVTFYFVLLL